MHQCSITLNFNFWPSDSLPNSLGHTEQYCPKVGMGVCTVEAKLGTPTPMECHGMIFYMARSISYVIKTYLQWFYLVLAM